MKEEKWWKGNKTGKQFMWTVKGTELPRSGDD